MSKYAGTQTEKNLRTAFAGESQARNKYTYFSAVAEKEGLSKIAEIFKKTASNEEQHAKMWLTELDEIKSTKERHEDRYRSLLKDEDSKAELAKSSVKVWECLKCGHIVTGEKAPDYCPTCGEYNQYFEVREDNYDLILTWGR